MTPSPIRAALHHGIRAVAERCGKLEAAAHQLVDARPFTAVGDGAGILRLLVRLLRQSSAAPSFYEPYTPPQEHDAD